MLRIHGGLSEAPKPGCSGTNTSKCWESRSNTGSHTGRPLAPCRNSSGSPDPPRRIRTVTSRTLWLDSSPAMPCPPCFGSRNVARAESKRQGMAPANSLHEQSQGTARMTAVDTERFRLRRFVERLVQLGECEIHDKPIDLVDVAAVLEGNPRAVWFKAVGPGKGGTDRQRDGVAQTAGAGARHR